MASGILGQANPAATTNTTIYTVPAATLASFSISIVNRSTATITARIGISSTATPGLAEWIEYGASIPASGVLERTGLVANATKNVVVFISTADASVSVYGYEE